MSEVSGNGWRMILGDCLEVMQTLGEVDHVITDPPYEAEAHTKARRSLRGGGSARTVTNAVRAIDAPLEITFGAISEAVRAGVGGHVARLVRRWVLAFCQIEAVAAWRAAFSGISWVRGGIWIKPNGAPQFTGDRPGQGYECIAIAHAHGRKRWNGGGRHAVWTCPLEKVVPSGGGSLRNEHPTTKPVNLMLELVTLFTDPGETILDPFAGSGTTGVAAIRLGRKFIGIEKDEKYYQLACDRLRAEEQGSTLQAAMAGQVALFGAK